MPRLGIANAKHLEHQGTLDSALRIVSFDLTLIDSNALGCDRVLIPVMLLLFIAPGELKEACQHLVLAQVLHVVQVDQDFVAAHLLKVDVIVDGSGLSCHSCLLRQLLNPNWCRF